MTTQPDSEQCIFRATPASGELLVEDWGDAFAVYQRPSGETHVFNDVTMTFLSCVRHDQGSLEVLVARVAEELEIPHENAVPRDFLDVVARLEELGLIERMTSGAIAT